MAAPCRSPLVVILGATGTGKSKLSLELARLFNGEIISADSMQVYKGLDIITNKVTAEEQRQCPHHMINLISPLVQNTNIVAFRNKALPIINSLLERKKTPIIVGGTNYYIEALLWQFLITEKTIKTSRTVEDTQRVDGGTVRETSETKRVPSDTEKINDKLGVDNGSKGASECAESDSDTSSESEREDDFRRNLERMDTKELHAMLREVDNETAHRLHPTEVRRIIRALEVYHQHGVPISNLFKAQHAESQTERAVSGPLRYTDTCIFWIQCNQQDARLDKRVDGMLSQGLVKELTDFHTEYNAGRIKEGSKPDYTRGIFQSIGFKEFHDYLVLSEEERQTDQGKKLLEKGIEDLKLVTRRYARKQVKWIRNRFLRRPGGNVPSVFGLDGSDVSSWDELVTKPATEILQALRQDQEPTVKPLPYEGERDTVYTYNECTVCDKVFVLECSWKAHLAGKKHKGLMRRAKILESRKRDELIKLTETLDKVIASGKSDQDTNVPNAEKDSLDTGENS